MPSLDLWQCLFVQRWPMRRCVCLIMPILHLWQCLFVQRWPMRRCVCLIMPILHLWQCLFVQSGWNWAKSGISHHYGSCLAVLHSAILRSRADSLRSHVILHEWIAFITRFWISTEVVSLQRWHGWCTCHMKLLPSRRVRVHHTTMHHVTSCKATYVRCMGV